MNNHKIKLFLLIFILFIIAINISFTQGNPLFDGKSNNIKEKQDNADSKKNKSNILWKKFSLLMSMINKKMNNLFKNLDNNFKFYYLILLIIISFTYGFFHAAGPGHGKSVLMLYYLSNKTRLSDGIKVSFLIGIMHSLMGVIIAVLFTSILASINSLIKVKINTYFNFISGALIITIGIILFISNLFNLKTVEEELLENKKNKDIFNIAFVVGIVPCPMVLAISMFVISMKYLLFGIIAIICISLGMSAFLLIVSIITIKALDISIKKFIKTDSKYYRIIFAGLKFLSSILIILIGFLIFISNFNNVIN